MCDNSGSGNRHHSACAPLKPLHSRKAGCLCVRHLSSHISPLPVFPPQSAEREGIALEPVARPAQQDAVGYVVQPAVGTRRVVVKLKLRNFRLSPWNSVLLCQLASCLAAWPLGRLAAWPLGRLAAWPLGRLAAWPLGRLAAWPLGRLAAWPLGRLAAWPLGRLAAWPLGRLAAWPLGRLAAWPLGRLAAWPLGRLAAWPLGRLAAWPLFQPTMIRGIWRFALHGVRIRNQNYLGKYIIPFPLARSSTKHPGLSRLEFSL